MDLDIMDLDILYLFHVRLQSRDRKEAVPMIQNDTETTADS